MPGCKLTTLYLPVSSVVAESSLLVSTFFTVTAAPGTTSLFGLVTTPPIAPVVVDCAKAIALRASTNRLTKKSLTIFDILGNSLGNELRLNAPQPFGCACVSQFLEHLEIQEGILRMACQV